MRSPVTTSTAPAHLELRPHPARIHVVEQVVDLSAHGNASAARVEVPCPPRVDSLVGAQSARVELKARIALALVQQLARPTGQRRGPGPDPPPPRDRRGIARRIGRASRTTGGTAPRARERRPCEDARRCPHRLRPIATDEALDGDSCPNTGIRSIPAARATAALHHTRRLRAREDAHDREAWPGRAHRP